MNNRINKIAKKKRLSRFVNKNEPNFSFDDLLKKEKSVRRPQNRRNLEILPTKMYKERNGLASACSFTKINTNPWVFFTFCKLYK